MSKIKLGTLCSGVGCPEQALKNLGIPYTTEYWCEIDKFAASTYTQLHGEAEKNLVDLLAVVPSKLPSVDLLVAGTPCQDFSLAGQRAGGEEGSGTRSSLMWRFLDVVRVTKPKCILWENVRGAVDSKNRSNFKRFIGLLEEYGYTASWRILNATEFGVPQNRERVFVAGKREGKAFVFPPTVPLERRLKDVKESVVDEKYYLSKKIIKGFTAHAEKQKAKGNTFKVTFKTENDLASTIRAHKGFGAGDNLLIEVGNLNNYSHEQSNRVYSIDGVAPTITTLKGGGYEPKIDEPLVLDEQNGIIRTNGIVGTITTDGSSSKHNNRVIEVIGIEVSTCL